MARDGEKPPGEGRKRRKTAKKKTTSKRRAGEGSRAHRTAPTPSRISKPKGKPAASGPVTPSKATRKSKKKAGTRSTTAKKKKKASSSRRTGRRPRSPGLTRKRHPTPQSIAPEVQKSVDEFLLRAFDRAIAALDAMERETRRDAPRDREHSQARREIFGDATKMLDTLRDTVERRLRNLEPEGDNE